jgi:hypothetical protein
MLKKAGCGGSERSLPEEDHPPEALLLRASHETLMQTLVLTF